MKSVFIAIPTLGDIRIELAQVIYSWKMRYGDHVMVHSSSLRPLSEARNECVRAFLASGRSWLLFIDSDVIPPLHAIDSLTATIDRPIVTAIGYTMKPDSDGIIKRIPLLLKKVDESDRLEYRVLEVGECGHKQYMEIDAAGMMCAAIHRSVFERVSPPWFEGHVEDFYFYNKARLSGFKVYADRSVEVKHIVKLAI